ncbi:MAG: ArnT family glycosyltransferase [bacterium]
MTIFNLPGVFQWQTLATNLISILTAIFDLLIITAIAYGFGKKILNLINIPVSTAGCQPADEINSALANSRRYLTRIEQFFFAIAVGLGLLSLMVFGLGLVEQLRYPILFAVLILGIIISYQELRGFLVEALRDKLKTKWKKSNILVVVFISIILFISFLSSLTPCTESDALRYHLAVPQFYLEKQGIFYDPYNAFSNFPFQIEFIYTLGLSFAGTMLPKLVSWGFFLLTAIALYSFTRRFFNQTNPLIPVAIYCATPFIPIISSWAFIESGLTFYIFMAVYTLSIIAEGGMRNADYKNNNYAYWIIFAIFSGYLLGIKYSMLAVVFFLWLIASIVLILQYKKYKRVLILSTWYLVLAALLAVPWYLKSYIYTGNPVYPMGYSVFDGSDWSRYNAEFYTAHAQTKGWLNVASQNSLGYRAAELVWLPWQATMNPPVSSDHPVNFGDWQLGPVFLAFIPILFCWWIFRKSKEEEITPPAGNNNLTSYILLLTSVFYYIFWSATYRDNRFLMPILPMLSVLIAGTISQLQNMNWGLRIDKKYSAGIFTGILWLILNYNALWMTQVVFAYRQGYHNPLSYILGWETRDQYLTRKLDYYPTFKYLNQNIPAKDQVLFIGEYRALYCHRSYYCSDYFDTPVILRIIQNSESVDQIKEKLAEMQVKYILFNEKELSLYFSSFKQRFQSGSQLQLFQSFLSDPGLVPVYSDPKGMTVYLFQNQAIL